MTPFVDPPSGLDRRTFMDRFGGVYEHNPWIAAAVYDAGQAADTVEAMADAMRAIVEAAPEAAHLTLLRAHPDLAGRLAMAGELTAQSTAEQAAAGLDQCSPEQLQAFQQLNAAYTARFGIPFIIAVRGLTRATILERFAQRLGNSQATEMRIGLEEVHRIARLRLYQIADSDEQRSALKP